MADRVASVRVTKAGIVGSLVVLVVAGVCVRLGIWQLHRLAERKALNHAVESRIYRPPLALKGVPRDTAGLIYRRVSVSGPIDNGHDILVGGRSFEGAPGVNLLSPVRLPDGGAILVDRGWLPSPDASTADISPYDTAGVVSFEGLVLPLRDEHGAAKAGPPGPNGFRRLWYGYDAAMLPQFPYRVASVYIRALPTDTAHVGGIPVGPQELPARLPPPRLSNGPHLGYAFQWFSFATIAIAGWLLLASRSGSLRMGESGAPARPRGPPDGPLRAGLARDDDDDGKDAGEDRV